MKYFLIGAIILVETSFLFWTDIKENTRLNLCYETKIIIDTYKNYRERATVLTFKNQQESIELATKKIKNT